MFSQLQFPFGGPNAIRVEDIESNGNFSRTRKSFVALTINLANIAEIANKTQEKSYSLKEAIELIVNLQKIQNILYRCQSECAEQIKRIKHVNHQPASCPFLCLASDGDLRNARLSQFTQLPSEYEGVSIELDKLEAVHIDRLQQVVPARYEALYEYIEDAIYEFNRLYDVLTKIVNPAMVGLSRLSLREEESLNAGDQLGVARLIAKAESHNATSSLTY